MKAVYLYVILVLALLVGCQEQVVDKTDDEMQLTTEVVTEETAIEDSKGSAEIILIDDVFEPEEVEIDAGGSVIVTNAAARDPDVEITGEQKDSEEGLDEKVQVIFSAGQFGDYRLEPGESFEYAFEEAGEYYIQTELGSQVKVIVK